MDPNNNRFNTQNSANYPFNFQNPNNYIIQNESSNQRDPQNIPSYGFSPNFIMLSSNPNYSQHYGSIMSYSSQAPPYYSSTPMGNENVPNVGLDEFPEFSTQMGLGEVTPNVPSGRHEATPNVPSGRHEATPNANDSAPTRRKNTNWTTLQNLVLISGWIRYGTSSVVGRNQKSEAYWGKIAEYCNQYCLFDPPRDGTACRNHYNYMNIILNKWIDAYDNAKRMQQSVLSENDVLAKTHELYSSHKSGRFSLMFRD
ncbi:uncharacterized protein LOC130736122 [Lotus japonicus]|uniref:uncharacterized protein LOC130736122 n=1 Tax=Lotus japonicus TaxID=34305 RepID=UPI0025853918|nr:uncharacterized protein LOC130736122 [Lotus japonicus]